MFLKQNLLTRSNTIFLIFHNFILQNWVLYIEIMTRLIVKKKLMMLFSIRIK